MSISEKILSMLCDQYRHELFNKLRYEQRRSFAEFKGFIGTAEFFKQEADGENEHAEKVLGYILDRSAMPKIEPIAYNEPGTFTTLQDLFSTSLDIEIGTTEALNAIFKAAFDEGDFMTLNFIHGMIEDQVEEEKDLQNILDRFAVYPLAPARDHDLDIFVKCNFVK